MTKKPRVSNAGFILVIWCLCLIYCGIGANAHATILSPDTHTRSLDTDLSYLIDAESKLTLPDVLSRSTFFTALAPGAPNFGHSDASIWVRVPLGLSEQATAADTWLIELGYPNLSRADMYLVRNNGEVERYASGYRVPMSAQLFPHHNFVFPARLAPGENVMLYFNVQRNGGAIHVPLQVWDRWTLMLSEARGNYVYGAFFGIMYAMILYNLFLFASIRLHSQIYYIAYLVCSVLNFHALTGYGHLILWPETPNISGHIAVIFSAVGVTLALQFLRTFVHTSNFAPRVDRWLIGIAIIGPCIALLQLTNTDSVYSASTAVYAFLSSIIVGLVAGYCVTKGSRPAAFFLLGWTSLLVGVSAFTLSLLGVIPVNEYTKNGLPIGAVIEVILLSLGIADRFNTERKERYRALAERHDTLVKLKETEDRLMFRALHSGTTGLPNRNLMRECLRLLIKHDLEVEIRFSLLLVNFRNFHEFNKTLGHQNGDTILRVLAEKLNQCVISSPFIHPIEQDKGHHTATIEGVTFGFVLKNATPLQTLEFAHIALQQLEQPFTFQGMSLQMDACMGISQYPLHGNTPDQLMRSAQIALELASNHPEQITLYSADEDPYSAKRLTLLSDLRHAIEQDTLELYLQPQLDLAGSRVTGAEVLIRWKHPQHGFIPPDQFIPLAERTGVIQPLTYWVFQKAFSQLQQLNKLGHTLTLSVNISARNLQDPAFHDKIVISAQQHCISPSQIVMELTETAMMLNETSGTQILYQLDRTGFGIAIDDFGTGYSSLAYLKRLPVQEIKIDRTFIKDMALQPDDQVIVTTTLQMGHNLGLRVVAEGIEDEMTLNFLRKAGCDLAQGYFIARPMPFPDFVEWLKKHNGTDTVPQQKRAAKTNSPPFIDFKR